MANKDKVALYVNLKDILAVSLRYVKWNNYSMHCCNYIVNPFGVQVYISADDLKY